MVCLGRVCYPVVSDVSFASTSSFRISGRPFFLSWDRRCPGWALPCSHVSQSSIIWFRFGFGFFMMCF